MKEDYVIYMHGTEDVQGEKESVDLHTVGSYLDFGNKKYIIYNEFNDDLPKKKIVNVLSIDNNIITLKQLGSEENSLVLEKGIRHNCLYQTPVGLLNLGVFTRDIKYSLSKSGGELYANYSIDFNSVYASDNELHITVEPTTNEENLDLGDNDNV